MTDTKFKWTTQKLIRESTYSAPLPKFTLKRFISDVAKSNVNNYLINTGSNFVKVCYVTGILIDLMVLSSREPFPPLESIIKHQSLPKLTKAIQSLKSSLLVDVQNLESTWLPDYK